MTSRMIAALVGLGIAIAATSAAFGQTPGLTFESAAYVTCREAHILPPDQRIALTIFLAEHSARHRGVTIPDGEMGVQLASLVRGGCTLSPDAYLFTVVDRAIAVELRRLPKR